MLRKLHMTLLAAVACANAAAQNVGARFIVTLAPGIAAETHKTAERPPSDTLDGRVFVIISRNTTIEPRFQAVGMGV